MACLLVSREAKAALPGIASAFSFSLYGWDWEEHWVLERDAGFCVLFLKLEKLSSTKGAQVWDRVLTRCKRCLCCTSIYQLQFWNRNGVSHFQPFVVVALLWEGGKKEPESDPFTCSSSLPRLERRGLERRWWSGKTLLLHCLGSRCWKCKLLMFFLYFFETCLLLGQCACTIWFFLKSLFSFWCENLNIQRTL